MYLFNLKSLHFCYTDTCLIFFQRTANFGTGTPQHHQAQSLGLRPGCHPDSGHAKHDVTKTTDECLVDKHIEGQWPKGRLNKNHIVGQGRPVSQGPVDAASVVAAFLNEWTNARKANAKFC